MGMVWDLFRTFRWRLPSSIRLGKNYSSCMFCTVKLDFWMNRNSTLKHTLLGTNISRQDGNSEDESSFPMVWFDSSLEGRFAPSAKKRPSATWRIPGCLGVGWKYRYGGSSNKQETEGEKLEPINKLRTFQTLGFLGFVFFGHFKLTTIQSLLFRSRISLFKPVALL